MKNVVIFLLTLYAFTLSAETLMEARQYEPIVLRGYNVSAIKNTPKDQMYVYAYHEDSATLEVIPFQIDERVLLPDLYNEDRTRHYYATSAMPDTNAAFDHDDELVFLLKDMGDKAPNHIFPDDAEARSNGRLEIRVSDPIETDKMAYVYVFHSSTLNASVPAPYDFAYDQDNDIVSNSVYSVRMGEETGLIEDVIFKSPYGNNVDIFDTQKIRLTGIIDLGLGSITPGLNGMPSFTDQYNIWKYAPEEYISVTENPIVRLVREVRQTIRLGNPVDDLGFFVVTKFYPFSGSLEGGESLDPEKLKEQWPNPDDLYIEITHVRQSWDFNENAVNMKFSSKRNADILVDGAPDNVDKTIPSGQSISEWTMLSGDQGTFFCYFGVADSAFSNAELYYSDDVNGEQMDPILVPNGDTGDGKSYGNNGIVVEKASSLSLNFLVYFLEKNQTTSVAEQLGMNAENPVSIASYSQQYYPASVEESSTQPLDYVLYANYPNPFNQSTIIKYQLPVITPVEIRIVDISGREIYSYQALNQAAGAHQFMWSGKDQSGRDVASGIYWIHFSAHDFHSVRKMTLVK